MPKYTFHITFLVGGRESVWTVTAKDFADAASKFKGPIVEITKAGYEVVKDGR